MQLIPFIFAIILAFFIIISRISFQNSEDQNILKFLCSFKKEELSMLKKIERKIVSSQIKKNIQLKTIRHKTQYKTPKKFKGRL